MPTAVSYEPRCKKTGFLHMRETKTQISCAVTEQLISAFVFFRRIVQSLYYLNPKFGASSYLLWLYSPVCVRRGRKTRIPVFSQRGPFGPYKNTTCSIICCNKNFQTLKLNSKFSVSKITRKFSRVGRDQRISVK